MILRALALSLLLALAAAAAEDAKAAEKRAGKVFSLFNVVTFVNEPCSSSESISGSRNRNGTCLTSTECSDRGGTMAGGCAAGFGSCCVFLVNDADGGTVTQNCSYIQNAGFPSPLSDDDANGNVEYRIRKCSNDVCDLRLDFEMFAIRSATGTDELGTCADTFTVTTSRANIQGIPVICGQNTGAHMYISLEEGEDDTATLAFAFNGNDNSRQWDIKITQIECNSGSRPPNGCLQYFVGGTGRIQTYNFDSATETHLPRQRYTACIRPEAGFCCIRYSQCTDNNAFTPTVTKNSLTSLQDSDCLEDYIVIDGGGSDCSSTTRTNRVSATNFCGTFLNPLAGQMQSAPVCDCSAPFVVGIEFDNTDDQAGAGNVVDSAIALSRGVCLTYTQIPCQ